MEFQQKDEIIQGIHDAAVKKGGFVCPARVFRAGTSVVFRCPVRRFKNSQAASEVGPSESKGKTRDRCCPRGHPRH